MSPTATRPRRKRDPESTRIAILEAAQTILARDGAEAMSVSRVANLAGVNRGTAYQHFQFKEQLIDATLEWVSQQLLEAVFEQPNPDTEGQEDHLEPDQEHLPEVIRAMGRFTIRLAEYAVENPDIGRIWLYDVLARKNPKEDVFFKRFEQAIENLAESDASEENVDAEALAVLMLTGYFLWPVWVKAHAGSKKQRREMARRFSREVLRLAMHGVLHVDTHVAMESFLLEQD